MRATATHAIHPSRTVRTARTIRMLVLLGSLTSSACGLFDKNESPTSPTPVTGPPAPNAAVHYTALGASDTNGIGSSVPCAPFDACPNGMSYVSVLERTLRSGGRSVTLTNRGIIGAVLSPTIESIARQYGRNVTANFLVREAPFVPRETTLVTIFGGGNDVNALVEAVEAGAGSADTRAYLDAQIRAFGSDYDRLVRAVRDRASDTFIIVINLPNFANMPYARGYGESRRRLMQHLSVGFSREANRQAATGIVVLDLMCDARSYEGSQYSSDGFHPNDAGYAYLAQRLAAIVNGSPSTPAASCSQMTAVPPL
jgi:lysophospholipase L1-like esterase